jgi:phosphohistidine phosphatase
MDLILLRHGKAEDDHPKGDSARRLVGKGREQATRAARLLKKAGRLPAIVLTSPYARARETAEIFCDAAGMPGPVSQGWLGCGMSPDTALAELAGFKEFSRILIVGHEPDFSTLAATLLGAPGGAIQVKKGALVGIRIAPPSKRGILRFLIPPKLAEEE